MLGPEAQHVVVELHPRHLVERGEGLVHQQDARPGDHAPARWRRASSCRPTVHADRPSAKRDRPTSARALAHARLGLGARHAGEPQRQEDVVEHRGPGHQRRLLKDEAEVLFGLRRSGLDGDRAGGDRQQPARSSAGPSTCRSPTGRGATTKSPSSIVTVMSTTASVPAPNCLRTRSMRISGRPNQTSVGLCRSDTG